jgi:hypothetical protein
VLVVKSNLRATHIWLLLYTGLPAGDCPYGSLPGASLLRFPILLGAPYVVMVSGGINGGAGSGTLKITAFDPNVNLVTRQLTIPALTAS